MKNLLIIVSFISSITLFSQEQKRYVQRYETNRYGERELVTYEVEAPSKSEYNYITPNYDLLQSAARRLQLQYEQQQITKYNIEKAKRLREQEVNAELERNNMKKIRNLEIEYSLLKNYPFSVPNGYYNTTAIEKVENVFVIRKVYVEQNKIIEYYNGDGVKLIVLKNDNIYNGKSNLIVKDPKDGEIVERTIYFTSLFY